MSQMVLCSINIKLAKVDFTDLREKTGFSIMYHIQDSINWAFGKNNCPIKLADNLMVSIQFPRICTTLSDGQIYLFISYNEDNKEALIDFYKNDKMKMATIILNSIEEYWNKLSQCMIDQIPTSNYNNVQWDKTELTFIPDINSKEYTAEKLTLNILDDPQDIVNDIRNNLEIH